MADPDKKSAILPTDDEDARIAAIEERLERLRKLHGWSTDTVNVSAEEVQAKAADLAKRTKRAKLSLRFSYGGKPEQTVEINDEHYDIGSGEAVKLRILDSSVASKHARITRDGDAFRVRDMNTQTGTWVNDARIPLSSGLSDGDRLRCGNVTFHVSIHQPGPTTVPPPTAATPNATVMVAVPRPAPAPVQRPTTTPASRPVPVAPAPVARPAEPIPEPAPAPAAPAAPAAKIEPVGEGVRVFVVYSDESGEELQAEIPRDRPLVVGRRATADLRLPNNGISSMHAAFEWADGNVVVRDLGSTNGTWVGGERVPRAVLNDQEVVRLGLVPVTIVFERPPAGAPVEEDEPEDEIDTEQEDEVDELDAPVAPPVAPIESGPANWHLIYVTDQGTVTALTMNARNNCVVAGEGPVEISVRGRGLKPEHLQFDWSDNGLEVMQARKDALLKVNGNAVATAQLRGGDVVSTGSLVIRVVRAGVVASTQQHSQRSKWWGNLFRNVDPQLEMLFVDPEARGGRVELSIWGDGTTRVEQLSGDGSDRLAAKLDQSLLKLFLGTLTHACFPDLPQNDLGIGASPELSTFWAEEREDVALSDGLAAGWPRWREVRDILRAIVDSVIE